MIPEHLISDKRLGIDKAAIQSDALAHGDANLTAERVAWLRSKYLPRAQQLIADTIFNTLEKPGEMVHGPFFVR